MTEIAKLLTSAIALANKATHEMTAAADSSHYAEAAQRLSSAWQICKEVELHEKYHMNQESGFQLPGEDPLEN